MSARAPRPASAARPPAARPADVAKVGLACRHSVQESGVGELARVEDQRLLILRARRGGKTPKEHLEIQQKLQAQLRRTGGSKNRPASAGPPRGKQGPRAPGAAALARPASSNGTRRRNKKEEEVDELAAFKECAHKIVKSGLSLDFKERPFYRTALWEATWKNNEEIVRLLADKKADVCARDYQDRTPLHEAAYYGHDSLVEFLLGRGHPLDCEDVFGQTPLFRACEAGRSATVELLVGKGARTGGLDYDSLSLFQVASFQGKPHLANWLVSKGSYKNLHSMAEERPCPSLEVRYERPLWVPPEARKKPPRPDGWDEQSWVQKPSTEAPAPEALRRGSSPSRQAEERARNPAAVEEPPRRSRAAVPARPSTISELPCRASMLMPRASVLADGDDLVGGARAPSRKSSRVSLATMSTADGSSSCPLPEQDSPKLAPGRPSLGRPASQPQLGRPRVSRGSISTLREMSMEWTDDSGTRSDLVERPSIRGRLPPAT